MLEQTNELKLLRIFFNSPSKKFHIRELARITKLNPNTVSSSIKELVKEGVLKKEAKTHIVEVSAHYNEKFKRLKRLDNIQKIYDSQIIEEIIKNQEPEAIMLMGSYSFGEDMESGDIDLVVISKKNYSFSLEKFEKLLNRKIHLIYTNYSEMSKEFYTNLINGVILYGFMRSL